jgi:tetratricopeptide (TPR) repeat protein
MSVAPISQSILLSVAGSYRRRPIPHAHFERARSLALIFSVTLLLVWPRSAHPQEPSSQFQDIATRAAEARDKNDVPLAIQLYRQAAQLKPDWAEGWFYLGLLEYSSNDFPAAIDALNHLLLLQPDAPPAMALRGLSEFETAAYDDALRDLEQAAQKGAANEPRNEQIIRYHYAQLLSRSGRFQDAILQYQFFTAHHIDDPDLLLGLGLAGMRNTALPKDIPPDNRQVYEAAGSAGYIFLAGDSTGADAAFKQLFARYPTTPNLHFFYGSLLFMHGPDLAIEQFRSEVALAPGNADAHAILAYALMIAGRYAEAGPEAELALAAAPGMEMAQLALSRSLTYSGDTKRAGELLNHILEVDPNNLEAHMALAATYSRAGRREDAYRERMVCLGLKK